MGKEGVKQVEFAGKDDDRQITAVLTSTISEDFLPPQIIYQGKTTRCLPQVDFPIGWHIPYFTNYWCKLTV